MLRVGPLGRGPEPVRHLALDPPGQELRYRLAFVVGVLAGAQVVQQLGQRVGDGLLRRKAGLADLSALPVRAAPGVSDVLPRAVGDPARLPGAAGVPLDGHGHRL